MRRPWAVAACAALVGFACARDPRIDQRPVYVYAPKGCPVTQEQAFGVFYAAGDFQASSDSPPYASLYLNDVNGVLGGLPEATRSLLVDVSQGGDLRWSGLASVPAKGSVNVLVWPRGEACDLTRNVETRTDTTLGVFGRHLMVVGGKNPDGPIPRTYVGDLSTGVMESLDLGLLVKRSRATVTPFATTRDQLPSPALVAGGEDPDGNPLDTAEVYVPKIGARGELGDFDRAATISLSDGRAHHGAVVLASGATLLVGGVGRNRTPLRTMEIVDPGSRQSRTEGLQQLAFARRDPTVIRLSNDEILVAGGTDGAGNPVTAIEWFSPDGLSKRKRPRDLVTGRERGIVPLPGGAALAVVAPVDPTAASFNTVFMISSEGGIEAGIPIDPAELDHVRLFEGANGAPVLYTGRRWMRWQPWFGAFSPIPDAPPSGPDSEVFANGDVGLAVWLRTREGAPGQYVAGWRFDARQSFESLSGTLLAGSTDGVVPDRMTGAGTSIVFDPASGLSLGPGATVAIPDLTFADFQLAVDVVDAAPEIVLHADDGTELAVGGAECAFAGAAIRTLAVERSGADVRVRIDDRPAQLCPTDPTGTNKDHVLAKGARVSLALRGAGGSSTSGARNLSVVRR